MNRVDTTGCLVSDRGESHGQPTCARTHTRKRAGRDQSTSLENNYLGIGSAFPTLYTNNTLATVSPRANVIWMMHHSEFGRSQATAMATRRPAQSDSRARWHRRAFGHPIHFVARSARPRKSSDHPRLSDASASYAPNASLHVGFCPLLSVTRGRVISLLSHRKQRIRPLAKCHKISSSRSELLSPILGTTSHA